MTTEERSIDDLDENARAYLLGWLESAVGHDKWLEAVRAARADRVRRISERH